MSMTLTASYIILSGVRFHAFHGVLPQERKVGADFIVDMRVGYSLSRAMSTDDVNDTISYALLYEIAKEEMAIPSNLIEHVAGRIAHRILSTFPQVEEINLKVTKKNPPMGADCDGACVEIHLINNKTN